MKKRCQKHFKASNYSFLNPFISLLLANTQHNEIKTAEMLEKLDDSTVFHDEYVLFWKVLISFSSREQKETSCPRCLTAACPALVGYLLSGD